MDLQGSGSFRLGSRQALGSWVETQGYLKGRGVGSRIGARRCAFWGVSDGGQGPSRDGWGGFGATLAPLPSPQTRHGGPPDPSPLPHRPYRLTCIGTRTGWQGRGKLPWRIGWTGLAWVRGRPTRSFRPESAFPPAIPLLIVFSSPPSATAHTHRRETIGSVVRAPPRYRLPSGGVRSASWQKVFPLFQELALFHLSIHIKLVESIA